MERLFLMFPDHTQRVSTVGRTPLDEWSARRRDLYLTTRDTHNRQISMPPVGFEPTISAGERPQAARRRGLCDELITRPGESYRLCCVVVCDLETSRMGAPYIYIYDISSLRVKFLRSKEGKGGRVNRNANLGPNIFYNYLHLLLSFVTQYGSLIHSSYP